MQLQIIEFESVCKGAVSLIDHLEHSLYKGKPEVIKTSKDLSERALERLYDDFNVNYPVVINQDDDTFYIRAYKLVEEAPWGYGDDVMRSVWYLDDLPAESIYALMENEKNVFSFIAERYELEDKLEYCRDNDRDPQMAEYLEDVLYSGNNKKINYFSCDGDDIEPLTTEDMCDLYKEYSNNRKFVKKHS